MDLYLKHPNEYEGVIILQDFQEIPNLDYHTDWKLLATQERELSEDAPHITLGLHCAQVTVIGMKLLL
jgi:hypothetical protein